MPRRKASEVLAAIDAAGKSIDVGELARELMDAFGGPKSFADAYVTEAKAARGIAKTKMLEGVLRIMATASAQNRGSGDSVGDMTDEELDQQLLDLASRNGLVDGGTEGGKEASPSAGPPAGQ